jgi:hypothetical protein
VVKGGVRAALQTADFLYGTDNSALQFKHPSPEAATADAASTGAGALTEEQKRALGFGKVCTGTS